MEVGVRLHATETCVLLTARPLQELICEMDPAKKQIKKKDPHFARQGQTVIGRFSLENPQCIETYSEFAPFGRFMLRAGCL